VNHLQTVLLKQGGKREDVADIVVHHQYLLAGEHGIVAPHGAQNLPLRFGKIGFRTMQ